jgi:hypothetical protein
LPPSAPQHTSRTTARGAAVQCYLCRPVGRYACARRLARLARLTALHSARTAIRCRARRSSLRRTTCAVRHRELPRRSRVLLAQVDPPRRGAVCAASTRHVPHEGAQACDPCARPHDQTRRSPHLVAQAGPRRALCASMSHAVRRAPPTAVPHLL